MIDDERRGPLAEDGRVGNGEADVLHGSDSTPVVAAALHAGAAAPALYYADLVAPFRDTHRHAAAYLDRLMQRPSFARAIEEAKPYRGLFPKEETA